MIKEARIDLLLPGLLGPASPDPALDQAAVAPLLAWLRRARAEASASGHWSDQLIRLAGLNPARCPIGPLRLIGEGIKPAPGHWFCADPIHLYADRDALLAFGGPNLPLSGDEAAACATAFNQTFEVDGYRLETPHPQRWYLWTRNAPASQPPPADTVFGRYVAEFFPEGDPVWKTFLTETQMLFHGLTVNMSREGQGMPSINGLWPWGGGSAPIPSLRPSPAAFMGNEPLLRGLALQADRVHGLGWDAALLEHGPALIFDAGAHEGIVAGEPAMWAEAVARISQQWLSPVVDWLKGDTHRVAVLHGGAGRAFRLDRRALRRLLLRKRPLSYFLQPQA